MCWMITTKLERVASVMSRSEVPAAASASARHLIVARLLLACKADRGGRTVEAWLLMRCIFNAIACHQ